MVGDEVNCLYLYQTSNHQLLARNSQAHEQGICEIVWTGDRDILSGSFDGSIAQICIDSFGEVKRRLKLGGTIWRIIPFPREPTDAYLICNSS